MRQMGLSNHCERSRAPSLVGGKMQRQMITVSSLPKRRTAFLYPSVGTEPPTRGQSQFSFGSSLPGPLSVRLPCCIGCSIFSPGTCVLLSAFISYSMPAKSPGLLRMDTPT
ncbi:hypothetical protein LZ31DRAFT_11010 [Colletotrichum somersetense]|nr:hypothetical protein LZ31DRAFT_11010 [Colletotrichum somersetense]